VPVGTMKINGHTIRIHRHKNKNTYIAVLIYIYTFSRFAHCGIPNVYKSYDNETYNDCLVASKSVNTYLLHGAESFLRS